MNDTGHKYLEDLITYSIRLLIILLYEYGWIFKKENVYLRQKKRACSVSYSQSFIVFLHVNRCAIEIKIIL